MKKLSCIVILLVLCNLSTTNSVAEQCSSNFESCNSGFNVSAESVNVSSCSLNSGLIQVTIKNKNSGAIVFQSISLEGSTTGNQIKQNIFITAHETKVVSFTGLANDSYTVIAKTSNCISTCKNIVVRNRKCFPLLYCCK